MFFKYIIYNQIFQLNFGIIFDYHSVRDSIRIEKNFGLVIIRFTGFGMQHVFNRNQKLNTFRSFLSENVGDVNKALV